MKVLIIEDNKELAKGLKDGLKREGISCDIVLDGDSGQSRIEMYHDEYDLIILDLMLPGKDGLSILKEIRAKNILIPVLIFTAKGTVNDIVSGLNLGADDYLTKPFSREEFFARVKTLLRRPRNLAPVRFVSNDLVLDSTAKKVFYRNKQIPLTLKEFALLEYFMRNPNQVLNREQILFNLWDFEFDSFSNVVDVHVKNLRRKLNFQDPNKVIETIYGIGYRFNS